MPGTQFRLQHIYLLVCYELIEETGRAHKADSHHIINMLTHYRMMKFHVFTMLNGLFNACLYEN